MQADKKVIRNKLKVMSIRNLKNLGIFMRTF